LYLARTCDGDSVYWENRFLSREQVTNAFRTLIPITFAITDVSLLGAGATRTLVFWRILLLFGNIFNFLLLFLFLFYFFFLLELELVPRVRKFTKVLARPFGDILKIFKSIKATE
jgi:hypothetical protein